MMIPYGRQEIDESDIAAVVKTLQSDYLTQGPAVPAFENAIKTYCGADYAVAVNSATSALHIACLALDVKTSDWVWTSPNSFVASANCALYCGAQIDFVPASTKKFLKVAKKLRLLVGKKKSGFLVHGTDRAGALASVLGRLAAARINVTAVDGVSAGGGRFGAILWVKRKDVGRATRALHA